MFPKPLLTTRTPVMIGLPALVGQTALYLLHIHLDTDLSPLFADHFTHLGRLQEADIGLNFEAQPALAIAAQAVTLGILLVQADAIQHGVRPLWVIGGPERAVLGTRAV